MNSKNRNEMDTGFFEANFIYILHIIISIIFILCFEFLFSWRKKGKCKTFLLRYFCKTILVKLCNVLLFFQFTLKYFVLKRHISSYKSASIRFASFFGIDLGGGGDKYRRLMKNSVPVKRLPGALIIGVKKCGTRALLEFLR